MNDTQLRRMWMVVVGLGFVGLILIVRLFTIQVLQRDDFALGPPIQSVDNQSQRGIIYDRSGAILAVNDWVYNVGISPNFISDPEKLADSLGPILQIPRNRLIYDMNSSRSYVLLASRVSSETAKAIQEIENSDEVQLERKPLRFYPQGDLMCHVLGFVTYDDVGGAGVERYYQSILKGDKAEDDAAVSPLDEQTILTVREGSDLVLTIDRAVQYVVEQHLKSAIAEYGAKGGSIIVMDPKTGALLAMAAAPCYSANEFPDLSKDIIFNPLVSAATEPGSVMKLITMAAALDSGTVTPETTYNDTGVFDVGGTPIYNWDRGAHGTVDMTTLLARSLNVGAATIATWMGEGPFTDYLIRFGFGRGTNVDIADDSTGYILVPGDDRWSSYLLGTYAYGQAFSATPLQMISAVSALANGGVRMEPYVVAEIHDHGAVERHIPEGTRVISETTAAQMTAMASAAVSQETFEALVDGYTIAGKTGTAQIAEDFGGYSETEVNGSFIGWLPADDPQIVVYVRLDRLPGSEWGSQTAAPAFSSLVEELVVMLDIPPDAVRLSAKGASSPTGGG